MDYGTKGDYLKDDRIKEEETDPKYQIIIEP
jgi:hypothetical protein